jgi:hypothetical protein
MQKFKIGDKVKYSNRVSCSNADHYLKFNGIYTVIDSSDTGNEYDFLVVDKYPEQVFYRSNFSLVEESDSLQNVQKEINKIYSDISMVDHPQHYKGNKFEVIDIIHDYNLGFNLGNAIKYILRAGKKDDIKQDLKKAIWYIEDHIKQLEKQ